MKGELIILQNRMKLLRKELNLTQEKFGERLGMKKNSISQIENGVNALTEQLLVSICREFCVNEEWLRTGKGAMFEQLTEQQKLMRYTALLLKDKNSAVATAIQALIITYEQLDDASKATLENIALQYMDNLKKSQ